MSIADAAVSVLVIVGLLLARAFGWLWMDPLAGIVGACVIASWSYGLIRDTGAILLDMNPDRAHGGQVRQTIEADGDQLADLHLWRLGPGHLGAILSICTQEDAARTLLSGKTGPVPLVVTPHYRGPESLNMAISGRGLTGPSRITPPKPACLTEATRWPRRPA